MGIDSNFREIRAPARGKTESELLDRAVKVCDIAFWKKVGAN